MNWPLVPLLALAFATTSEAAPTCAVEAARLVCKTTSAAGKALKLTFATDHVEHDPDTAVTGTLCTTPAKQTTEAKLWMPEHGHGSLRTRLAVSGDCTKVSRMVFSMRGFWEIRVKLADGDTGVLHVDVP